MYLSNILNFINQNILLVYEIIKIFKVKEISKYVYYIFIQIN